MTTAHRYGPHSDATAPTTVTIGAASNERQVPMPEALLAQRRRINELAYAASNGIPVAIAPPTTSKVTAEEWGTFLAALATVVDENGEVHQGRVRPLIRGRIQPKHIGSCYSQAKAMGLLTFLRKEPSTDAAGRNTHHDSPVYALAGAA